MIELPMVPIPAPARRVTLSQTHTDTICPDCGVRCNLTRHVQDNQIVNVSSPDDHDITRGHLCIKGRFGFQHVSPKPGPTDSG